MYALSHLPLLQTIVTTVVQCPRSYIDLPPPPPAHTYTHTFSQVHTYVNVYRYTDIYVMYAGERKMNMYYRNDPKEYILGMLYRRNIVSLNFVLPLGIGFNVLVCG